MNIRLQQTHPINTTNTYLTSIRPTHKYINAIQQINQFKTLINTTNEYI